MFTGIVEEVGTVKQAERKAGVLKVSISAGRVLDGMKVGESINVDGVCLTVVEVADTSFKVDVVKETLDRTTFSRTKRGTRVNLERALQTGSRLGGHFVNGHVDCIGRIIRKRGRILTIEAPGEVMRYILPRGSTAVDGISLTVQRSCGNRFDVAVIPYTEKETTLGYKKVGERVNIETDIVGKYVEKFSGSFSSV